MAPQPHATQLQPYSYRSLVFHVLGLCHMRRRRAGLLRHAQHRQRSTVCAEHLMEEVEACKKLLENIFPPQAPYTTAP